MEWQLARDSAQSVLDRLGEVALLTVERDQLREQLQRKDEELTCAIQALQQLQRHQNERLQAVLCPQRNRRSIVIDSDDDMCDEQDESVFLARLNEIAEANYKDDEWQQYLYGKKPFDWSKLGPLQLDQRTLYVCPYCYGRLVSMFTTRPFDPLNRGTLYDAIQIEDLCCKFNPLKVYERCRLTMKIDTPNIFIYSARRWTEHVHSHFRFAPSDNPDHILKDTGVRAESFNLKNMIQAWHYYDTDGQVGSMSWFFGRTRYRAMYNQLVDAAVHDVDGGLLFPDLIINLRPLKPIVDDDIESDSDYDPPRRRRLRKMS